MAGGGIFLILILALSFLILAIWLVKGSGCFKQKAKLSLVYLSLTLLPGLLFTYTSYKFDLSNVFSTLAFVLLALFVLSGFILPIIGNRVFQGSNEQRI